MKATLTLLPVFFGVLLLALPLHSVAQQAGTAKAPESAASYTVTGTILDTESGKPISYATVYLTARTPETAAHTDTTVKTAPAPAGPQSAVVTDGGGQFSLRTKTPGTYTLHATFAGYASVTQDITLDAAHSAIKLNPIQLSPSALQAQTVTVTAQKPLVTTEVDKIVYNTDADPETPSLTALEMLRKVPMLTVDGDDNLQLKGQGNYKILVNGKTSTLISKNYKDVLKSMPAGSIKSVEIITNPPSKYDAEGIAGIINIITTRKTNNGYNGSLRIGADQWGGVNGSAYIAAALGKFSLSANYYGNSYRRPSSTGDSYTENYNNDLYHHQYSTTRGKYHGLSHGLNLEASYEIDTFNLITLGFWGNLGNNTSQGTTEYTTYDLNNQLSRSFRRVSNGTYGYGYLSGNLDYQKTFRKPDRTFTLSYKLDYNPSSQDFENHIEDPVNYTYSQRSENRAHGGEHTFQADYFDPITKKHQIEAGVKYILRPNVSNTDNERQDPATGTWQPDGTRTNDLDYRQHIVAGYLGYLFKLKKFSVKAGLRGEYTINDGKFILSDGDYRIDHDYFNLIPYATLSLKPDDKQNISLGYTQRLSRPGIWYLNPYVDDLDPLNVSTGNPLLNAETSHSLNLSYGRHDKIVSFSFSGNASLTNNAIEQISTILDNGGRFSTYGNIGRQQNYGGHLWTGIRLFEQKFNININAGASYRIIDANNDSGLHNEGWSTNGSLFLDARPWKNGSVYANGGVYYSGVSLESNSRLYYYYSMGISQYFLDKKLQLSLNASNPFQKTQRYTNEYLNPEFRQISNFYNTSRSFRVSLSWRFGKMQTQVKKARRGISNDDVKSGGGSSQGGGGGE